MIDKTVPVPREALAWFAGEMERQLRENDHKPGWSDDSLRHLAERMRTELREVENIVDGRAVRGYATEQLLTIIAECADVANFAMMVADNAKREIDAKIERALES